MSMVREIMDYAEEKLRTENQTFCLNEILAQEKFKHIGISSASSLLTQVTAKGGLVREMKTCPLGKRDHWHYKFNKSPERKSRFKRSISKDILEFAKDKSDLKEPFFCIHEINKALGIPENNVSVAIRKLIEKNKISRLDLKYRCQYSDRVHPFYKYFVAGNKPVEEKPIVPEKVISEKPKRKYKKKISKKKYTYKKKKPEVMQPIQSIEVFQPLPKENDYKKVEVTIEGGKFIIRAEK